MNLRARIKLSEFMGALQEEFSLTLDEAIELLEKELTAHVRTQRHLEANEPEND